MESKIQSNTLRDFSVYSAEEIIKCMDTDLMGKEVCFYENIDSTNNEAKKKFSLPEGTIFVAREQWAGKGRIGRKWISDNDGICLSVLLKPDIAPDEVFSITLVVGLAVSSAIQGAMIKWPNDIVLNSKKVGGILTEMSTNGTNVQYVVAGIGINLNNPQFHHSLSDIATSVYLETDAFSNKSAFVAELCMQIEKYYKIFKKCGLTELLDEYKQKCITLGKDVVVKQKDGDLHARAIDVTDKGELVIQTQDAILNVLSGEVSVRGVFGYV